jgi:hypothetical protein
VDQDSLEGLPALTPDDFELMRLAIESHPDVDVAIRLVKEARRRQLEYPVSSVEELTQLLKDGESVNAGELRRYVIDDEALRRRLPQEWFPIQDERELLRIVHLALAACREKQANSDLSRTATGDTTRWVSVDEHGSKVAEGNVGSSWAS